jgi:hypothetical protein
MASQKHPFLARGLRCKISRDLGSNPSGPVDKAFSSGADNRSQYTTGLRWTAIEGSRINL